jgi:outer membrane protein assembly factor BamB
MQKVISLFLLLITGIAAPAEIVGWRNDWTGVFPEADPPTTWTRDSGVVWKTKLPGLSNASPILIGDRLFVSSDPDILICVNREDGTILWERPNPVLDLLDNKTRAAYEEESVKGQDTRDRYDEAKSNLRHTERRAKKDGIDASEKIASLSEKVGKLKEELKEFPTFDKYAIPVHHRVNGHSTPTPVSDGNRVFALFGTGVVVCYDLEGNKVWGKFVETPQHRFGHSASPLMIDDMLLVQMRDLLALDAATGEEKWRANVSSYWGTPIAAEIGGTKAVVTPNGDVLRASDGEVLASELSSVKFSTPVLDEGIVYFIEAGGRAVEIPSTTKDGFRTKWTTNPRSDRYYSSPVIQDGLIYTMTRNNVFSVIDQDSGEVVYSETLPLGGGDAYPSIVMAGEHLFASNSNGTTVVLKPGREYVQVAKNSLEKFMSTPIFAGSRMYLRGNEHFYCIGR